MADIQTSKKAPYEGDMDSNATINYRNEVDEWTEVNRKLKNHGLHIIKLLHPSDVALMTGRTVCLDSAMSKALRDNVLSLVADCDHRQTLIQDLIITNNKLKEDLEKQTNLTSKYHGRMKELQVLLESSRSRVQELEEEEGSILVEEEKLVNTKKAMHAKCKQLTQRCQSQEKEIERLKTKLQKMAEEEDKRANRQSQVFQEFKKRTARAHSVMDEKLLDIIDAYEKQVLGLQKQIEFYKSAELGESRDFDDEDQSIFSLQTEPSNNMKSLVRTYEKQLRKAQDKIKQLENDRELIRLDAGSRPQLQDYRVAQQRMKKLEKLLAVHNISIPGEKPNKDPYRLKKKYSTKLEDLDYLPLDFCRQHLRDICTETDAEDLEEVIPLLQKQKEYLETSQRYEQFCRCVQDICQDEEDQQGRLLSPSKKKNVLTEKSLQRTVAKLQCWKQDQDSLQELQISINRLGERVAPWLKIRMSGDPSMTQIISAVDKIVYDDGIIREKDGKEHPSRTVLENIVQHFQTLFDVPSVSGVFPRMNDIYTKLGEVHNVLNTLRNLLGLDPDAKSSEIVDAVGHLCQTYRNTTSKQLKSLLQTEDLEGVIRRLEEHSDFFPAFQEIVRKLFEILDIQRMDQIIPAVRALKLLAG
uniref:Centrosomal protein of 70 kDa n=1 Tax=Magallana gigas TaxID=29159 RepID=A0A8W8MXY4_MAGGI|nr:centrosomal protein of 70 kDa isoform X1 [Crassostrea gigas]|eukprot:XP_011446218.1 PREDICTED: centrosomal protein of 70 kDa isoform X1 [Crassostrea gigas]